MDISRTTVMEIYESAREKVADCIVNGRPFQIAGEITASATDLQSVIAGRYAVKM